MTSALSGARAVTRPSLVLVESNTTGTGRLFARAARARGLRPVLLSTRPDRYRWAAEDGIEVVWADTTEPESVALVCARLGRQGGLAGLLTSSEYSVAVAARAAARLGLPGPEAAAVEQCRDKRRQRTTLQRAGVPVPAFEAVGSVRAAVAAAADLGLPVVVKPADGTGSRGVRLCPNLSAVAGHARRLLSHQHDERGRPALPWLLVESYVDGPEVSVESFKVPGAQSGRGAAAARFTGVTDKHLGPLPGFVETGHDFPAALPHDDVVTMADRALAALGLGWGAAHIELRLGPSGPVVIEVNPRLAGGQIPILVRLATGIDLIGAVVDLSAGAEPQLPPPGPGHASIRFLVAHRAGVVERIGGLVAAAAEPGVVDVAVHAQPGDRVGGTDSFLDRLGHVIGAAAQRERARRAAERGLARLLFELAEPEAGPVVRARAG